MLSLSGGTKNILHLKEAIQNHIPVIQFDRTNNSLKSPRITNEVKSIVHSIMEHFYQQGYRNIGYLAGPQNIDTFRIRKETYEECLQLFNLKIDKSNVEPYDLTRDSAKTAAYKLLTKKNPPDAILAASDMGAFGVWEIAKKLGINVPEKLGICGFSNEFYTEIITPSITTINQFSTEMGRIAAQTFFESINKAEKGGNNEAKNIIINPELIIRESTSRIKTN